MDRAIKTHAIYYRVKETWEIRYIIDKNVDKVIKLIEENNYSFLYATNLYIYDPKKFTKNSKSERS